MERPLHNKVIFLTGGAAGIGLECRNRYRAAGAQVVVFDKTTGGDVSSAEEVSDAIERTLARHGRIDVIHNNAGIAHPSKPLHETTTEEWNALFDVNVKAILHTTRYGLGALKATRGSILNTSSLVASIGQDNHAAYAATKGAIDALTKSMALDYAPYGIRVNAIAPAGVWTPMLRAWGQSQPNPTAIADYLDGIHALGYCPEPDVIADACVFLLSDQARFITGHILPVSGGAELG
ncbi:MAG TPA: SDR family oxidoreductase, partial [Dinghuibacter sp.]|uniref:SDR family NAD(P)-dependent oxidoreductase n=1 Tax=Dinghuibacter sp. TaxID=2024697 RepID=UPI002C1E747A